MKDPTTKYRGELSPRNKKIAEIVSIVGQPPFLSIPAFVLICVFCSKDLSTGALSSIVTIITATVIPILAVVYYSKKYGNDDHLDVVNKEDRFKPLIAGATSYAIGTAALYLINAPRIATMLMLCYAVVTVIVALITPYWKISIHSCGVIGPSIGLAITFWPYGLLFILLLPPIAWSRYVLKKHTPLQLVMGAVLGFVISMILLVLLL